jgi:hypothetical protein
LPNSELWRYISRVHSSVDPHIFLPFCFYGLNELPGDITLLSIDFSYSKKEEIYISYTPQYSSKCFQFIIKRFSKSIGTPVFKKVKDISKYRMSNFSFIIVNVDRPTKEQIVCNENMQHFVG